MAATRPASQPRRDARRRGRPARRLLLPTDRSDLIVTWHDDDDRFVLSLWHEDVCAGTASLSAPDAAEVASFLVSQLGERGRWTPHVVEPEEPVPQPASRPLAQRVVGWVRRYL